MAEFPQFSRQAPSREASKPAGWLYEVDGEEHGPFDFRTLRSHAVSRKLLGHHPVWKEGSGERQNASLILGLIPPSPDSSAPPQPAIEERADPYAAPQSSSIGEGPPGGLYLPHLSPANFPLYLVLLAAAGGLVFASREIAVSNAVIFLLALAGFCLVGWIAFSVIYLHRAWEMMRMLGAHLTGTKAVRFLFLPFFNALWCFVVVFGWARLWNHNVKHHPGLKPARPVWPVLFFLFPILLLISQGFFLVYLVIQEWPTDFDKPDHLVTLGVWAATLLITLAAWGQICRSINFLARKKS